MASAGPLPCAVRLGATTRYQRLHTAEVVNAVFVQQTMKTASSDEELAFKQKQKDMATYTRKVKRLFQTIDISGDGAINLEEFAKLVSSPKLQFWMLGLILERESCSVEMSCGVCCQRQVEIVVPVRMFTNLELFNNFDSF